MDCSRSEDSQRLHTLVDQCLDLCHVIGTNLHGVVKTDLIQLNKLKFAAAPTEKKGTKSQ